MNTRAGRASRVFPARAGMSRAEAELDALALGVPRASGDEPKTAVHASQIEMWSPRERG